MPFFVSKWSSQINIVFLTDNTTRISGLVFPYTTSTIIIKLDWGVCTSLTQLYDGRDMYRIYYIKNDYMFRPFTLAIIRLRNEKT